MKVQSNFDKRDSLKLEKAFNREIFCDSFHGQNAQCLAGLFCKRDLYAGFSFQLIEVRLHRL
jgi:hypothetical protein